MLFSSTGIGFRGCSPGHRTSSSPGASTHIGGNERNRRPHSCATGVRRYFVFNERLESFTSPPELLGQNVTLRTGIVAQRKQVLSYCFMAACARFFSSAGGTSSLCVAIHQWLPDESCTPALRSP